MSKLSGKTFAVMAIGAAIGFGSAVTVQSVAHAGIPAAPTAEPHERMQKALESLRNAKEHLEKADHDFHGHRVKAIEATTSAIEHVEAGLKE